MHNLKELCDFYLELPFNKFLDLTVTNISHEKAILCLNSKPDLIGNTFKSILHGGVIMSVMDAAGGLLALAHLFNKIKHLPKEQIMKALSESGTVDIRVDFLRPGSGMEFNIEADLLRGGKRIAATRIQMSNQNNIIANASATYLLGNS